MPALERRLALAVPALACCGRGPLSAINLTTVNSLGLAWSVEFDSDRGQEATPLAVDGVLYTTTAWSKVLAFDAKTGELLWSYDPKVAGTVAATACCDVVNREAAFWGGKVGMPGPDRGTPDQAESIRAYILTEARTVGS